MYDRDSNLERLAGYGNAYARWEIFQIRCLAGVLAFGAILFVVIMTWQYIVQPHTSAEQQREEEHNRQSYNLTESQCLQAGHYWSSVPVHMNDASWTLHFCTQSKQDNH